jgi:electron transfer flavoprotein beta subunit
MNLRDIFTCFGKEIKKMTADELDIDKSKLGLLGSPTKVMKSFTKAPKGQGEKVDMPPIEAAGHVINKLREKHFI